MAHVDPTIPATKQDISLLMEEMGKMYLRFDQIDQRILESEERTKRHFDVCVEDIRHDAFGSQKDKISLHDDKIQNHERRILALERRR